MTRASAIPPTPHAAQEPADLSALTTREREIVGLIVQGLTYREIGKVIFRSWRTVEHHVDRARLKLRARNRTHLAVIASRSLAALVVAGLVSGCASLRPELPEPEPMQRGNGVGDYVFDLTTLRIGVVICRGTRKWEGP